MIRSRLTTRSLHRRMSVVVEVRMFITPSTNSSDIFLNEIEKVKRR